MDIDLKTIKNVHFVGIGGIGISAIARMFLLEGKNVTGQDMQDSGIVHELQKSGAKIIIGQSYENIPSDTELIVYTIAIETYDTKLFEYIKNGNIKSCSYPEMLGIVTKQKYTIAISGTHGKTTTTGMIAEILLGNQKDPTVIIGSLLIDKDGNKTNFIAGDSSLFVVEACEYRRSFLNINPKVVVITNIDEDHLDYYKDIEDIKSAFRELVMKVPSDGYVICNPKDNNISDVISDIKAHIIDCTDFFNINLSLKVPGIHNKKNASCAIAVGNILNINKEENIKALLNFSGTWRRFEYKGELPNNAKLYDDYAHHPAEVSATLSGFRELYKKEDGFKITVIFQPHLFSRTKSLLYEFAVSFNDADKVLILPIYYAREVDDGTISSQILANEINKNKNIAFGFDTFKEVEDILLKTDFNSKDIIVTMGAGEAYKIGDILLSSL